MQGWHVIVPGLCGPFPKDSAISEQAASPLLALLSGSQSIPAADSFYAQLATLFGLPQPLPVAALTLHAEHDDITSKHCIQLAPVHLHADMDHAILYDEFALDLSPQEKQQLLTELNAHFSQDDIAIISDARGRWFIVSDEPFSVATTALHEVIGRNINFHLPTGENAVYWKRFLNEAQMLMHQSPVNAVREQNGQLAANSLWLWGQGALSNRTAHHDTTVYTNDDLLRGVAQYANCDCHDLPTTALPQQAVICDTRLLSAASYGDVDRWRDDLQAMMQQWLGDLPRLARQHKVEVTVYPCHGSACRLPPGGWRNAVTSLFARRGSAQDYIRYDD